MKKLVILITTCLVLFFSAGACSSGEPKALTVYYSLWGNTAILADLIHQTAGGDVFVIETETPYPADAAHAAAQKHIDEGVLPALKNKVDIASYDIIFIGTPNWFGTVALPVKSFLKEYDLSGKTIVPFATFGGSADNCLIDIVAAASGATALEGFSISGDDVKNPEKNAKQQVIDWLTRINVKVVENK
ncbi:MAG: flavodoxin family protein [Prevotellaceae bacterium]|jgi:flavodoxin|nr:flavodoxin family protein [Prevotellaceae bacterium]